MLAGAIQRKKLLGQVKVRNGLYRVEHEPEHGMAADVERISAEELHRRTRLMLQRR